MLLTYSRSQVGFCGSLFASLHNVWILSRYWLRSCGRVHRNYQAVWLVAGGASLGRPRAQVSAADFSTPRRARVESRLQGHQRVQGSWSSPIKSRFSRSALTPVQTPRRSSIWQFSSSSSLRISLWGSPTTFTTYFRNSPILPTTLTRQFDARNAS